MSDKIYDIMEAMQNPNLDADMRIELEREYNSERDQESFEYDMERLKGGNMIDREYYESLDKIYKENMSKLEDLEKELKDIKKQYKHLTTNYTEEISNVYISAMNSARNWMLFFVGTTIGCMAYILYLVLVAK